MKRFYLVENKAKSKIPRAAQIIKDYLKKKKAVCVVARDYGTSEDLPDDTECILVLGGDGTMIKTATLTAGKKIPMIGVNMGHFGYLTSISREEEIIPMLDALLHDEYTLERHCILEGWGKHRSHSHTALNELAVGRRSMQKSVRLRVSVNGELLNEYTADGIIVATPTGSTAYNLAAGGPIVQPDLNVFIITPICPHVLVPGSIVVSDKSIIEIEVVGGDDEGQLAIFDGDLQEELVVGSKLTVKKSRHDAVFVRLKDYSFVSNIERKLR